MLSVLRKVSFDDGVFCEIVEMLPGISVIACKCYPAELVYLAGHTVYKLRTNIVSIRAVFIFDKTRPTFWVPCS